MNKTINILLFAIVLIFAAVIGLTALNPQHCFDVLDKLPNNEIAKIYYMSFKDVAHTHPATHILSCYLRESHSGDESIAEQYFNVYAKCDEYKREHFEPFGYQQLEELVQLGLPFSLEKYLRTRMETGNKKDLEQGILHVQDVMGNDIELSGDYKDYKQFILMKYKPNSEQTSARSNTIFKDISVTHLEEDSPPSVSTIIKKFNYYLRNLYG